MVTLRKAKCYRRIKRAYTRKSKFKTKSYVKAIPQLKIIRFTMGDQRKRRAYLVSLVSNQDFQLRQNALESSRVFVNKHLHDNLGLNYFFRILVYPHHVLRENRMLTGAGSDRMQRGMQKAFGAPVGIAAQIKNGQKVMEVNVDEKDLSIARHLLKKSTARLPGTYSVIVKKI
ncbi:50S ribosomal protein L16 [Candidatus Woesearchaeota archaeon]|nr:50S ribosomal protein L16 [Candidatus Woesearchaeota archaeon]